MIRLSRSLRSKSWPWVNLLTLGVLITTLAIVTGGCGNSNRTQKKLAEDTQSLEKENFDTDLTFNAVTLEEFDKQGRLWWKVKAEQASYSRDKKRAKIQKPKGEFYQDGKAILKVSADGGEIFQDGQRIFLRGNIKAVDTRDGLTMQGNELEWRPREDIVLIRNTVSGTRKNVKASAQAGKYLTRKRRLELEGKVVAEAQDPAAKFAAERVVWLVEKQKLLSDRPLQVERYENKVVSDRATAASGEMDIKTQVVTLKQTAQVSITNPPLQVSGNQVLWRIKEKIISSTQPITIVNSREGFTLVGNQGDLNLNTKILNLVGNVNGSGGPRQSFVKADRLVWNLDTQAFEADGNVTYRQATPPLNVSGPKATGGIKDQQVIVSGGRVVTEFIP
ncbi:MAG: hypothetical protein OHK0047_16310 [Leptolyngbyaceae cyanobacterium]